MMNNVKPSRSLVMLGVVVSLMYIYIVPTSHQFIFRQIHTDRNC